MTRIALVRHGQTDWNTAERLQGASDIDLNGTGRAQARRAVDALQGGHWDVAVSSPLSRARETADIIASALGVRRGPDVPLLIERDYGEAEGITREEALERWPEALTYDAEHPQSALLTASIPDGGIPRVEPTSETARRGVAAVQLLAETYPEQSIIAASHGTIIRLAVQALVGHSVERLQNGGAVILERGTDGAWAIAAAQN